MLLEKLCVFETRDERNEQVTEEVPLRLVARPASLPELTPRSVAGSFATVAQGSSTLRDGARRETMVAFRKAHAPNLRWRCVPLCLSRGNHGACGWLLLRELVINAGIASAAAVCGRRSPWITKRIF